MNQLPDNQANNKRQISKLVALCLKADKYAIEDPEVALIQARKAAEAICLYIFSQEIGTSGKIMLNDLIKQLGDRKLLPRRMQLPLTTIQSYGNYGSHHQDECEDIDSEFVEPCLSALKQILDWFFLRYLNTEIPNDLKIFVKQPSNLQSEPVQFINSENYPNTKVLPFTDSNLTIKEGRENPIKVSHLPVDELIPILDPNCKPLTLNCPCDLETSFKANQMASFFYGSEAIPFELYEQWWNKNPQILTCLTSADGEVLGYFDVFPLKNNFLEDFIEGRVGEDKLNADSILSPSESIFCCQLYLGGIAVKSPNTFIGSRNATILLWGLLHYLKRFYPGNRARMLYAIGSTIEGDTLLRKFNFSIMSPANTRVDNHNFYTLPFTPSLLDNYQSLLQDWSGSCDISWKKEKHDEIKILAS